MASSWAHVVPPPGWSDADTLRLQTLINKSL